MASRGDKTSPDRQRDMLSIYVVRLFSLFSMNSSPNLDLRWMPQAAVAIEVFVRVESLIARTLADL